MNNYSIIRNEILKKNSDEPYFVKNTIYAINTDYDVFPYPRWYKSKYDDIAEREAGWIPKKLNVQKPKKPKQQHKNSNMCFQTPCSVIYPCYNPDSENYLMSNRECKFVNYHT